MKTTQDGYNEGLIELAKYQDIICISADTKIKEFAKKHPDKILKLGKTEQNLLSIASGLASEGKIPFVIGCPTQNFEQLNEICKNNLNVKIADIDNDHIDIALTRILPNITVIVPADYDEARKATIAAGTLRGPVYIKLIDEKKKITDSKSDFTLGRAEILRAGKDCTIIACGKGVSEALEAADRLEKQEIECTVLNSHTIQPIDKQAIASSARVTGCIVTVEEQTALGSSVAEIISQYTPVPMRMVKTGNVNNIIRAVKETVLRRCESICTAVPEEHGRRLIYDISPELHFKIQGGGDITNIPRLEEALINMKDKIFAYHCNKEKNDFSAWINGVFKERTLAENLAKVHTRIGMILEINRWLST